MVYHICSTHYKIIKPCGYHQNANQVLKLTTQISYGATKHRSHHQIASKTISIYNRSILPTIELFLLINSNDTLSSSTLPTSNALLKKKNYWQKPIWLIIWYMHILDCNSIVILIHANHHHNIDLPYYLDIYSAKHAITRLKIIVEENSYLKKKLVLLKKRFIIIIFEDW